MSSPTQPTLLRRTAAAVAAASGFIVMADGHAQSTVTLQGTSGSSCAYSGMTVAPNGSVVVQCASTSPTAPGSFALSTSSLTAAPNTSAILSVTRSGGSSGAFTVSYSPSGAGCTTGGGSVSFADGDANSKSFTVGVGASGSCTVSISSTGTIGSPNSAVITIGSSSPPPTNGCPATPTGMLTASLGSPGQHANLMAGSGQITSAPLPRIPADGKNSGYLTAVSSPSVYTPPSSVLEISINKCPGVIDTNYSNACNKRMVDVGYGSLYWFARTAPYRYTSAETINSAGACYAPEAEGQWYLNMRWTYSSCSFGAQTCGFNFQWNAGSY